MTDQDHAPDLERAREQGRADLRPFAGVAGVTFPTTLPVHQAVQAYERLLTDAEPHLRVRAQEQNIHGLDPVADLEERLAEVGRELQAEAHEPARSPWTWLRRRLTCRELARQRDTLVDRLGHHVRRREQTQRDHRALVEELAAVRSWLDQWVTDAARYAPDRARLRRPLSDPPSWVRTYPSSAAFIAEDPRRANTGSDREDDTGGRDHGYRWRWTDPSQPTSAAVHWRVSWLCSTGEVYAVRRKAADNMAAWSDGHDPEPVWLLSSLPATARGSDTDDAVAEHLLSLEHLQDVPRESLLALVDALADTDWDTVLAASS